MKVYGNYGGKAPFITLHGQQAE